MARPSPEGKTFEKKLEALENIVSRLEAGDASLEESLQLFEKGTTLLKDLSTMLDEAERRVEILTRDASGTVTAKPFEEESGT